MVSHCQLQNYNPHYCISSITGCLGCRWHRYQQTTESMRKCDVLWLFILIIACCYINLWFYFWLLAGNDLNDFNWYMYNKLGCYFKWYSVIFGLTVGAFVYVNFLIILCFLHLALGHQVYIHKLHKCLLVVIFLGCVAATVLTILDWITEWGVIIASIQITSPFLHMTGVILMTLISWIFIGKWLEVANLVLKILYITVYIAVISLLYITPLFITSPCITTNKYLPVPPSILAHRGASSIAPENTLVAFDTAAKHNIIGFETDVSISMDGVLFLLHDKTFKRTTNINTIFPDRVNLNAAYFNFSDIKQLDAGSWFLETNPFDTLEELSREEKNSFINQSVLTFDRFLALGLKYNKTILLDINLPPMDHPYYNLMIPKILDAFDKSKISQNKIWWIPEPKERKERKKFKPIYVSSEILPVKTLMNRSYSIVNGNSLELPESIISTYKKANISVNVYVVNSPWLYSLYWCMGVNSVTSDYPQLLKNINVPVWLLTPDLYLMIWIGVDILSFLFILVSFILQKIHHNSKQLKLQSFYPRSGRVLHTSSRNMKEKLIQTREFGQADDGGLDFNHSVSVNSGSLSKAVLTEKDNIITKNGNLKLGNEI